MEVTFDIGATVDIATGKEVADGIGGLRDELRGRKEPKPLYSTRASSLIIPAANEQTFMDLGSPPVGRMWNVLGITLAGTDSYTNVANAVASVFCGDSDLPSLIGLKVTGLTVPGTYTVSDKVFWCHSSENLVIGISGAVTAGQQIIALAHVAEWRECDVMSNNGK